MRYRNRIFELISLETFLEAIKDNEGSYSIPVTGKWQEVPYKSAYIKTALPFPQPRSELGRWSHRGAVIGLTQRFFETEEKATYSKPSLLSS